MLQPGTSVLILIDKPVVELLESAKLIAAARRLCKAASVVSVPLIIGQSPKVSQRGILANACDLPASCNFLDFDPEPTTWPTSPLGIELSRSSRNQIIVAGIFLEEAVTLFALNCLVVGYDTYVAVDAILAAAPGLEHAACHRLAQAGAVPTSSHQIIHEWAAFSRDAEVRDALTTLLVTPPSP